MHRSLLVPIVTLALFASFAAATDADALRALMTTIRNWPSDWNSNNISPSSYCTWTGIVCNEMNKITEIRWGTTQYIQGYFPPELAQLSSLQVFGGPSHSLYGTIPAAFWALPNLTSVALTRGGLTGYLPNTISPSLKRVNLWRNRFNGTIPSAMITPGLTLLKLSSNRMRCPLPAALLSRFSDPNLTLDLESNDFEIVTGKVCGQVDFRTDLPRLLPVEERIPKFPLTPSYEFGVGSTKIMLKDRFVLIGDENPVTGEFYKPYYAVFDFQGVQLIKREAPNILSNPLAVATALPFALPLEISDDGHLVNATQRLTDGGKVTWYFQFEGDLVKVFLKVSNMAAFPFNVTDGNARHQILMSYHIKAPSSGSVPLRCPADADYMGGRTGTCQSDGMITFSLNTTTRMTSCRYHHPSVAVDIDWPLGYEYDGSVPGTNFFEISDLSSRIYPFGDLEPVNLAVAAGDNLGTYNQDYQFISNMFLVNTHPFRSELTFGWSVVGVEPAIDIPPADQTPPSSAPTDGSNVNNRVPTSLTPAVYVGIGAGVLGFIAIVIVIVIFAPRLKQALCGPRAIQSADSYQPLMVDA